MGLIAGKAYDPGTVVNVAATALAAMTAFDTTNLRHTFDVPANGKVMVRIAVPVTGSTTPCSLLLGVMSGASVVARVTPCGTVRGAAAAASLVVNEAVFVVDGLTPGATLTWDAAYSIDVVGGASTVIRYGGPNNTTSTDAGGAFIFEIWDADNCLESIIYDPSTAVTNKNTTSNLALTALDTTNLRATFTVPANGRVLVRMVAVTHGATTNPTILLGVLEGSTVRGRAASSGGILAANAASSRCPHEVSFIVDGLTQFASCSLDAAYAVESVVAATAIKYGGPNDTTTNNAWGGFIFEIWDVG